MNDDPVVITVGMSQLPIYPALQECIARRGLQSEDVENPEELPAALARHRRAAVLVYSKHRYNGAHHTLSELARLYRGVPVVVLVEKSCFSEYYELMSEGALYYKDLTEGVDDIAATVARAAEWYSC